MIRTFTSLAVLLALLATLTLGGTRWSVGSELDAGDDDSGPTVWV